ncbi:MAG: hypothetical protein JXQ69_07950 [Paludibacteraceae bacterium]|nr:hypothetical protein [Paludibacteraceae bacterium]MBN2788237.1 hypothetical protein [Paludibacteraceae bacterium]
MNNFDELKHIISQSGRLKFISSERLDKELMFIEKYDLSNYFIEASKYVEIIKEKGFVIGPAYGYSNSSVINYLIGTTTINPEKYGLLFELYLNSNSHKPYFRINTNFKEILETPEYIVIKCIPVLEKISKKNPFCIIKNKKFNWRTPIDYNLIYEEFFEGKYSNVNEYNAFIKNLLIVNRPTNINDLINCLAINDFQYYSVNARYGLMLFREDWILIVSDLLNITFEEASVILNSISLLKTTSKKFCMLSPENKDLLEYLYVAGRLADKKSKAVGVAEMIYLMNN